MKVGLLSRIFGTTPAEPPAPGRSAQYMRGEASPFFFGWNPSLRDARDDVRMSYTKAAARAIDALHNSGWISGAVDQAIAQTIGTGLRLSAKPDFELLGWTPEQANAWSRVVERRYEARAANPYECDAAGKWTMAEQTDQVLRSYYANGEALALLPMIERGYSLTKTRVQLIPPQKLSQESNGVDLWQGVWVDGWGMPVKYRIKRADPATGTETDVDIPARDGAGRCQIVHVFQGREGQMRGITPLTPALRKVRIFEQLGDATLESALLQALFAATVTSEAPTDNILSAMQDPGEQGLMTGIDSYLDTSSSWYENSRIDLGRSARIAHMFPGESLNFHTTQKDAGNYEAFAKFLLREIARCLGVTFESLTGDYSSATYSSVRMATSEMWPLTLWRRKHIAARFLQADYEAWLEEMISLGPANGGIEFGPGLAAFFALRCAVCAAEWRGPPKPQADDLKAAKAHETYRNLGVITDAQICADLGWDVDETYEERAREKDDRGRLGLPEPVQVGANGSPVGPDGMPVNDGTNPANKQDNKPRKRNQETA